MSDNKTKPTAIGVEAFLDSVPDAGKRADALVLIDMMQRATGEKPVIWGPSIIGFGSYHYRYDSGREGDSPVVGFSPRKAALVLYIVTGFRAQSRCWPSSESTRRANPVSTSSVLPTSISASCAGSWISPSRPCAPSIGADRTSCPLHLRHQPAQGSRRL